MIFLFIFERLGRMQENKTFFFVFLIPNLYIYSIKIQTNIKQKFDRKICGKVIDFLKVFLEIF
jgi:hypothetical protein